MCHFLSLSYQGVSAAPKPGLVIASVACGKVMSMSVTKWLLTTLCWISSGKTAQEGFYIVSCMLILMVKEGILERKVTSSIVYISNPGGT